VNPLPTGHTRLRAVWLRPGKLGSADY
jgi:hypothetical protein